MEKLLDAAWMRRQALLIRLHAERTDSYRIFHGVAEGMPGITVDRYGPLVLVQSFRKALDLAQWTAVQNWFRDHFEFEFSAVYRDRLMPSVPAQWSAALGDVQCREFGVQYLARALPAGKDPWLFLDLRGGRRALRAQCSGKSILNLFSYTCSVGITAACAGAGDVWNVDFSASHLEIGKQNAELNSVSGTSMKFVQEDCLPMMRQLAGLSIGGRRGKTRKVTAFQPRHFDWVVLDPPAWSKGSFGAVDVAGDYASLFKSAVLIARPKGGAVLATNHVAEVNVRDWHNSLERCAAKAGRPLVSITSITPEEDFPSFDGRSPLKVAICRV